MEASGKGWDIAFHILFLRGFARIFSMGFYWQTIICVDVSRPRCRKGGAAKFAKTRRHLTLTIEQV